MCVCVCLVIASLAELLDCPKYLFPHVLEKLGMQSKNVQWSYWSCPTGFHAYRAHFQFPNIADCALKSHRVHVLSVKDHGRTLTSFCLDLKLVSQAASQGKLGCPNCALCPFFWTRQKNVLTEECDFLIPLHQQPCSNRKKWCMVCGAYPWAGSGARGVGEARAQHGKPGVRCVPLFSR